MSETLLSLKGISKRFGGIVALENVCFDTFRGEVLGLMGPNGAGKTTLLNIIAGTFPPDSGTIHFNGQEITGQAAYVSPKMGIARTYQIPKPFVTLSVLDNLRVASTFGRPHGAQEARTDFDEILDMAGLLERKDQIAETLPILSLKKLELARALACEPELILLDEIAAGLTDPEIPKVLDTIKMIQQLGITVIIVEHVMKVMMNAVDRIVVLDKGTNLCEGTTEHVINDKLVIEAYFGTE